MKNFYECGNLGKKKQAWRPCNATCQEKVSWAKQVVTPDLNIRTRRLSQRMDVSFKSAQRIKRRNLSTYPYKVRICQKFHVRDFERRVDFCSWFLQKDEEDPTLVWRVIMSDEAHFGLNECVNWQSNRGFGAQKIQWKSEESHSHQNESPWGVQCVFMESKIIGTYFLEDCTGQAVTVNGQRYHAMLTDSLIPAMNEMNVSNHFFQLDSATWHTTRTNMEIGNYSLFTEIETWKIWLQNLIPHPWNTLK